MFPPRRSGVLGKKVTRCFTYGIPFNHSKTVLFIQFDSVKRSSAFVVDELMKDGEGFGADSELPHCCHEGCNVTFGKCKQASANTFPQEVSHLHVTDLFGVHRLLVVGDILFWCAGGDCLRFRQ